MYKYTEVSQLISLLRGTTAFFFIRYDLFCMYGDEFHDFSMRFIHDNREIFLLFRHDFMLVKIQFFRIKYKFVYMLVRCNIDADFIF